MIYKNQFPRYLYHTNPVKQLGHGKIVQKHTLFLLYTQLFKKFSISSAIIEWSNLDMSIRNPKSPSNL